MVPITIDMIWSLMFQEGLSDKFLWVGVRIVTHVLSISICHENRVFAAILFDELRPELARTDRPTGPGHWRHNEWTLRSTRCSRHITILHSPWGPIKVVLRVKLEEKLSFNYNCVTPWWGRELAEGGTKKGGFSFRCSKLKKSLRGRGDEEMKRCILCKESLMIRMLLT